MKKLLAIALLLTTAFLHATSVTATITDSDGQVWSNGNWTATLQGNFPLYVNGVLVTATNFSGVMDGTGTFTVTLTDNSTITPVSSFWRFTLCSKTSAPCSVIDSPVTGSSLNLSTTFSANVKVPRFNAVSGAYGYIDAEAMPGNPGSSYFNTTSGTLRVWNGTTWSSAGGGGSYNPAAVAITGGSINGTSIGQSSQAAADFTSVTLIGPGALNIGAGTSANFLITPGGSYTFLSFNGSSANATNTGILGSNGGGDANLYLQTITGGGFNFQVAGTTVANVTSTNMQLTGKDVPVTDTNTPTAGQAVCIKSAGPPVQLGTCTGVVSSGGACTCS